MGERCAWINDPEIGMWFSPACMGGAVYGEGQCTCAAPEATPSEQIENLERMVAELKARFLATPPETTRQGEGRDG